MSREGVQVAKPYQRLTREQMELVHQTSMELLQKPGVLVYSQEAVSMLSDAGCSVTQTREGEYDAWWVSIPSSVVQKALETAPSKVVLGARNPENKIIMDAKGFNVYFGSGSETNFWLDVKPENFVSQEDPEHKRTFPTITRRRGTVEDLCKSAHLSDNLENLDFFIRNVNIQDSDINESNKDVNKFFASLNNITKHVMGGLTDFGQMDHVVRMAEIIAGGRDELLENPVISFITSVIKSPMQVVDETAEKLITVARLGLPVVISSSPQGGSTAPIDEAGMVAQVNAEVLTGIVINQLASPGAPVIYGAVPVRARMDDLHDMYGVPEFCHYNTSCAQMARYYEVPCYSTAGVGDAKVPGMQAAAEKMFTHAFVPRSGPDIVHYAFGLLEKTNTFCPEQAVLDNHHIGLVKFLYRDAQVNEKEMERVKNTVEEVMQTPHRLFSRYARRLLRSGGISPVYPFEGDLEDQDGTLLKTHEKVQEILEMPRQYLSEAICQEIYEQVPGLLPRLNPYQA